MSCSLAGREGGWVSTEHSMYAAKGLTASGLTPQDGGVRRLGLDHTAAR